MNFGNVVNKNGLDLVFVEHEHNYSRRLIDSSFSTNDYKFAMKINQVVTIVAFVTLNNAFKDNKSVIMVNLMW